MKKWMIACMALLLATACKDEIDHSGEVHATAVELYSVEVTTAMFAAEMYGDGITERGICWSEEQNPTTADSKITDAGTGAGAFTTQITGLEPSTTYYVRAYAIAHCDAEHPYYSSQFEFTTSDELTATLVSTSTTTNKISATITVAGGASTWSVSECGIAYGKALQPDGQQRPGVDQARRQRVRPGRFLGDGHRPAGRYGLLRPPLRLLYHR